MKLSFTKTVLGTLVFTSALFAQQPTVGGLLNNFSYIRPGLPNYGIAQGSIFDIFGTNLAPTFMSQGVPLKTTLGGTSISVTVNGTTTQVIPYFVSSGQIAGILPSATPVGTGTITVTVNGLTSAPAPIVVVESAFGILTANNTGAGAAAAYNASNKNQFLAQTASVEPGEYIVLWGSGLGPAAGDETVYQTSVDLTNIPIEVDIGGVKATVAFHGRSAYPGLDQINVIVPAGVTGCSVSVVVLANGVASNYSTIPVATGGRTCSDPSSSPVSTSDWQTLSTLTNANLGFIGVGKDTITTQSITIAGITIPGTTTTNDFASGSFVKYSAAQLAATGFGQTASIGSCVVTTFSGSSAPSGVITTTPLDAGPQINLNGPDGLLVLAKKEGFYTEAFTNPLPAIVPAGGGTFKFDNGTGGADIKGFTTSLNAAQTNPLVWTNMSQITAVDRSKGFLVTWSGGITGSIVAIVGSSFTGTSASSELGATFYCTAPVSAGQFTVPSAVLESMPPTAAVDGFSIPGFVSLENSIVQKFTATGLDLGLVSFSVSDGIQVPFN